MKNYINKLFKKKVLSNSKDQEFNKILNSTDISKLFECINNYSATSELRYVGGCIRKILNEEEIDDIDLATNLNPEEVKKCLTSNKIKYFETGIKHGTITAHINKKNYEITSLRKDLSSDGRHSVVEFTQDWLVDSKRRDFTINSIYSDTNGNLFDPFDGREDLKNGKIRFIGDPNSRIQEDYLRILRYVRFFLNYSKVSHDPLIKKIIKQNISGVIQLSKERLISELKKIIFSKNFAKVLSDEFCMEIILLVFPQLKYFDFLKNPNKFTLKIIDAKDFDILISLMIIDETDNSDFFLYKFNLTNETKQRIKFLKSIYSNQLDKNFYSKDNLWKILYKYNNQNLKDIFNFKLSRSKKLDKNIVELKDYFQDKKQPIFPIKAKDIMEKYNLKESKYLGEKLKEIESIWIDNSFKISKVEIDKVINN